MGYPLFFFILFIYYLFPENFYMYIKYFKILWKS